MSEHGLFVVLKFGRDGLDTSSRTTSRGRMPPARTYDTDGKARAQWTRYQRAGFGSHVAQLWISPEDGEIHAKWIDAGWVLKPEQCKSRYHVDKVYYHEDGDSFTRRQHLTCQRDKGHDGLHSAVKDKHKETSNA